MEINWRSLGKICPKRECLKRIEQTEQGPAIWMLVWSIEGEQLAYVGQTDGKLAERIEESVFRAKESKWEEFFRVALTKRAGHANLFVVDAPQNEKERNKIKKIIYKKNSERYTMLDGNQCKIWPDWLTIFHAESFLCAMNEYKTRKNLEKNDEDCFKKCTQIFSILRARSSRDAIDDLDCDSPLDGDRAWKIAYSGIRYLRSSKIRDKVKKRSKGRCEISECAKEGFVQRDGSFYVECHHIIALAKEGKDSLSNVIALCPEHHREAHFGKRADELEKEMIRALEKLRVRRVSSRVR